MTTLRQHLTERRKNRIIYAMDDQAPLVDYADLGRRFKAARILAGHESVTAGCDAIADQTGLHIPHRAMYAIEKGEQHPSIEQYMAVLMTYRPPYGGDFLLPAFRDDVRKALRPDGAH